MASPKRNANRRKFNRQPLDVDDLTSASSFSGIRDVIESHFGKSEDQVAEGGGAEGPRNVEPDPEHPQFVWEPKGVPFSVRLDAGLIARLEKESLDIFRALTNRGSEIGGILLGQVLPGWPVSIVVSDYEPVVCAYTLGPSYLLSEEEQEKLAETIEKCQKPGGPSVVGFFRSNTRPALVLQDDDQDLFEEFFPEDHNIFLLAKPYSRKPCQGAIYVREGGKIRTDVSALEFAFSRPELEKLGALQPGLRLSSGPAPAPAPSSNADRGTAIPINRPAPSVMEEEPKPAPPPAASRQIDRPEAKVEPQGEPKIAPQGEPKIAPQGEPKIAPPAEPKAEPSPQQRIEARLPWLKPTGTASPARPLFTPPADRPAAPPSPVRPPLFTPPAAPPAKSATPTAPASPARPLFAPPAAAPAKSASPTAPASPSRPLFTPPAAPPAKSATPTAPASPARPLFAPPAARPAAPPAKSATPTAPASPARPLFTPAPRIETRATTPPQPMPAAATPAKSVVPDAPAETARPLFTPPPAVEKTASEPSAPPSPPRFSARIQTRTPASVQPRIEANLGSKPAHAQPTRFMPRIEPRTAPQPPKPEPKPETAEVSKVEPPPPPKPAARTESVVVVRQPAQPRTEVRIEPKAEVKVEPRVEPEGPRFPRIDSSPGPEFAAPAAGEMERRKPQQTDAPNFGYKKPEPEDDAASQGNRRWILPVVIALLVAIVGVYFVIIRPNRKTAEEAPAATAQTAERRPPVELSLKVEGSDAGLNIFWDGLSAPVSTAPRGVLSIRDGAATKSLDLTSDELKKGTYLYTPRTDDVLIRLELKGLPGNQVANGGTRVFGARRLGKTSGH